MLKVQGAELPCSVQAKGKQASCFQQPRAADFTTNTRLALQVYAPLATYNSLTNAMNLALHVAKQPS